MQKLLQALTNIWGRMNPREQRLALIVAALAGCLLLLFLGQSAYTYLQELDRSIRQTQDNIINYTYQIARKQIVESQYAQVSKQHSSEWSEEEIQDRLRSELYRLAEKIPPPLDENGIPIKTTTESGKLVEIPQLHAGILAEGGEDYREYKLNFRIPAAKLSDMVSFIERLQTSPQTLRIDTLDFIRNPLNDYVRTNIDITRTVASGVVDAEEPEAADAVISEEVLPENLADWKCRGGNVSIAQEYATTEDGNVIKAVSGSENTQLYALRKLHSGKSYLLQADITATGDALLGVAYGTAKEHFPEPEKVRGDGRTYQYQLEFTLPEIKATTTSVRAPYILLQQPETEVYIDNLIVQELED